MLRLNRPFKNFFELCAYEKSVGFVWFRNTRRICVHVDILIWVRSLKGNQNISLLLITISANTNQRHGASQQLHPKYRSVLLETMLQSATLLVHRTSLISVVERVNSTSLSFPFSICWLPSHPYVIKSDKGTMESTHHCTTIMAVRVCF